MLHTFKLTGGEVKSESLKINRVDGEIRGTVSCFSYKDKDTGQYVLYCPSFEVSGYGEDKAKAEEMFNFSLEEFLSFLIESKVEGMQSELRKLGWTHNKFFQKEFSKAFVDAQGMLQDLNAENDSVERVNLTLAA